MRRFAKGLKQIDQEETKYTKDSNKITKKDAEKVAAKVKSDNPIFKSIKVADGGKTWDYKYVASPEKTKIGAEQTGALPGPNPDTIRFTQDTCTKQGNGYSVIDNIQKLRKEPDWDIPQPIRVFTKTKEMDKWGKLKKNKREGDPKNLADGLKYTLDNRRLYAYREAKREAIPVTGVNEAVVKDERWKFTTKNQGTSCKLS